MDRRGFLTALAGTFAGPLAAEGQQAAKVYHIGFLTTSPPTAPGFARNLEAFRQALAERGWVEGRNILIEYRSAEGKVERLQNLAAELARLQLDLIVSTSTPATSAIKQATSTIPVVMTYIADPVGAGIVASLARPGGNITGVSSGYRPETMGKLLELLKEIVPKLSRVAVLRSPGPSSQTLPLGAVQTGAEVLGVELQLLEVQSPNGFEAAFATMKKQRVDGLIVWQGPFFLTHARHIVDLAAKNRLPAVYALREFVEVGGLMGYAVDPPEMLRRTAGYVDRILRGAKPADLPIEDPTKYEVIINLKTAKVLGLTIPPSLLLRADQVIE
jgi:putative ABC transport system substrate-binding protein